MSEEIPSKYKTLFARVYAENSKSKSDAIKAFCLRCVDYKYKRVRDCSAKKCPLHQVRPFQINKAIDDVKENKIDIESFISENNKKIVNYLNHKFESDSTKEIDFSYEALQRKIIELDEFELQKYNIGRNENFKLHRELLPCPFEGNIEQARVVLLLANPSCGPNSLVTDHMRPKELKDWGLWSLHDDANVAMRNWWRPRLKLLLEDSGLSWQQMSNKVAALQINPWASRNFDESCKLPSFNLMQNIYLEFAKRDVLFIVCRAEKLWNQILGTEKHISLNSRLSSYITRNNLNKTDGAYDEILKRITE